MFQADLDPTCSNFFEVHGNAYLDIRMISEERQVEGRTSHRIHHLSSFLQDDLIRCFRNGSTSTTKAPHPRTGHRFRLYRGIWSFCPPIVESYRRGIERKSDSGSGIVEISILFSTLEYNPETVRLFRFSFLYGLKRKHAQT
jgi:hypothetical protein